MDFLTFMVEITCRSSEANRRSRCYKSTPQIAQVVVTRNRHQIISRRGVIKSDIDFDSCLPAET